MSILMLIQDTTIVDSIPAIADSVAAGMATTIGDSIKPLLAAGLAVLVRFIYEGSRHILKFIDGKSPMVKSLIALGWSQVAVFGTMLLPAGAPDIPADIGGIATFGVGLIVWVAAMGVNTLIDIVKKRW